MVTVKKGGVTDIRQKHKSQYWIQQVDACYSVMGFNSLHLIGIKSSSANNAEIEYIKSFHLRDC